MLKKLVLFDIDGTLLRVSNSNRRILRDALMAVYGTEGNVGTHNFAGKMDSAIIHEVLSHAGLHNDDITEKLATVKQTYIALIKQQLRREDIVLMKGVTELLRELSARDDILLGLLTGNFEGSGRHKLELPSLNSFFPFGAFADDAASRNDLPAVAVERAQALTGKTFLSDDVVIVGDTEHDITCAQTNHAKSVAVATGTYPAEKLDACRPDALFHDFSDTERVVHTITEL